MEAQCDAPNSDVVYIPSQSIDPEEIAKMKGFVHYEERPVFCSILRLRSYSSARCVFVTSIPIPESVISYYLNRATTSAEERDSICSRLLLLSVEDASPDALSKKIIQRPDIIETIKNWIRPARSFMRCVICTLFEEELASLLQIPLRATPSKLSMWGTKHGSRTIFKEANIEYPGGSKEVFTTGDFIENILELWEDFPAERKFVAKLNDGVSGDGNAILYLHKEKAPEGEEGKKKYILQQLENMEFARSADWTTFETKLQKIGAIAEVWISGDAVTSPSAQGIILENEDINVLSTHEQILDDRNSLYLGCSFPSNENYRSVVADYCSKIGKVLASHGAKERFGVDFVVSPYVGGYKIYAIEINLRSGGTTHPMETARLLCNGTYCNSKGTILDQNNIEKYYKASDNLVDPLYSKLSFEEVEQILQDSPAAWNSDTLTGCVSYFLGAIPLYGKLGMLAIANSKEEATELFTTAAFHLTEAAAKK